jgi:hypothetical protein
LGEAVKLYYNPNNPKQIFIVNDKEILGFIFIFSFGLLLLMMGKSFLFKKQNYETEHNTPFSRFGRVCNFLQHFIL